MHQRTHQLKEKTAHRMAENMCKFISVNGSYLAYTKNFLARQFFKSPIKKLVKELQ